MLTKKYLDEIGLAYYHRRIKGFLDKKVDTVAGKGLSTNDYTDADKEKLENMLAITTVGENLALTDGTLSAIDTTYSAGSGLSLTDTTFSVDTTEIQEKLTAGENITINNNVISAADTTYSDFVGASSSAPGTSGLVPAPLAGDEAKYLSGDGLWKTITPYSLPIASSTTLGGVKIGSNLSIDSTGVLTTDLATVATSGSYTDLSNKPIIPTVNNATLTIKENGTTLDIFTANSSTDKIVDITVPTKVSDLDNDEGFITGVDWDDITDKPTFATVATSGSYTDLSDKPTIPTVPTNVSAFVNDAGYQTASQVASAVETETENRQAADNNLQSQIDGITASSDVKDIVGTYADLQDYDTSTLGNNDIIKVLQDESHSNETTYYRWSTSTETFTLIGEEGPYYTKSQTDTLLNAKADISSLATVATTGSYSDLTNKPSIPTKTSDLTNDSNFVSDASYVHTDNNFTTTLKNKLDGIASGAEVNVQANWTQTDTSADDYIKNKPTIPAAQVNSDWNASSGVAQILNKPNLATVATTGSYNDLSNTPTKVSDFTNDAGYQTASDVATAISGKQDTLTAGAGINITSNTISVNSINSTDWSNLWQ